jgi:hypothetical protein
MKALRTMEFGIVRKMMDIKEIPEDDIPGYQVGLDQIIVWNVRERRLHGCTNEVVEFHLKLDGRPLFGNFFFFM